MLVCTGYVSCRPNNAASRRGLGAGQFMEERGQVAVRDNPTPPARLGTHPQGQLPARPCEPLSWPEPRSVTYPGPASGPPSPRVRSRLREENFIDFSGKVASWQAIGPTARLPGAARAMSGDRIP